MARAVKSCEAHSIILQVFYSVLYQVPNLLLLLLLLLTLSVFCWIDEGLWSRSGCNRTSGENDLSLFVALSHVLFVYGELFVFPVIILDPPEILPVTSEG